MTAGDAVLAIDAGQTSIKTRVRWGGDVQDEVFPGIRTHASLLPQLAEVAHAAITRAGAPVSVVAAGVSGLTSAETDAGALRELLRGTAVTRTILAHDSTTSFLGALGDARGAVVAAGTGVVTLAVGGDAVARVDGWGYLVGDAGSGYWIGREALAAVMRDFDGRGPATALRAVAQEHWPDLTEAYIRLQTADDRVSVIAGFAAAVAAHTDHDAVAADITRRAADELAHSVTTALRRVHRGDDGTLQVCALGGVFRSAALRAAFQRRLTDADLDIALVAPRGQGIDGAAALANLPARHPLATAVAVSDAASAG
ncbi:BadF/BadG/BcrA/BcrD ATPase family protein [Microbacterium sp. zg-YB36]|uniref:N-acetylglucosamine kinase n=1 Tax=Microbacterium sp. zg-YB36 TaxID=2969407 RepID=UPI00214B1397|nr:BadF/BadG/BcrA/BcrD ATPase family protein [Microbacterium sp. zg-YB36]MDL5352470.1 BadF/BadG/BcrA/BcrD ATPase family protein [Microbacterium sp. zg-YB36]